MPELSARKKLPTVHWLCYSIGYSIICFLACCLLDSPAIFPLLTVVAVAISTICLAGIWSAYGTGSVLPRCLISVGLTFIVGLGIVFGLPRQAHAGGLAMLPAVPAFCCAAQAVHWLFRIAFGWQFVVGSNTPVPTTLSIRELLFLTLLVAISIAGIRVSASLFLEANPQFVTMVEESDFFDVDKSETTTASDDREKKVKKAVAQLFAFQIGMYAGTVAVASLLMTLPLLLVSYPKDLPDGITWFAVVIASSISIWIGINSVFGFGLRGVVNLLFLTLAVTCIAFTVPLIHTRALGVCLQLKRQRTQA